MAAAVVASKACFSQLAFSGASIANPLNRVARPAALPRRSNFAVRASLETKDRQTAIVPSDSHESLAGTALAGSLFSMLATAPSAFAAQEVMSLATADAAQEFAQIAEGADYRPLILLVVLAPAVGWVLFNILPPALKQLQRMLNNRSVIGAVGLGAGASLLALPEAADAAQEFAQLAEGADYRPLILLVVLAPAVGWVLFNILPPALKQLQRMLNNRSVIGAVGLGAGASLLALPETAEAAQEFAQLAEGADYRPLILLLVLAPALGWVGFNILQPALRQLETAMNKNK